MQGMKLSTLYILIYLQLITVPRDQYDYYVHFPDEDICPRSALISGRNSAGPQR